MNRKIEALIRSLPRDGWMLYYGNTIRRREQVEFTNRSGHTDSGHLCPLCYKHQESGGSEILSNDLYDEAGEALGLTEGEYMEIVYAADGASVADPEIRALLLEQCNLKEVTDGDDQT